MYFCLLNRSAGFQLVRRCCYGEEIATSSVHICPERLREPYKSSLPLRSGTGCWLGILLLAAVCSVNVVCTVCWHFVQRHNWSLTFYGLDCLGLWNWTHLWLSGFPNCHSAGFSVSGNSKALLVDVWWFGSSAACQFRLDMFLDSSFLRYSFDAYLH